MEEKWHLKEAIEYYRAQGAPGNQTALIALLKETQERKGGVLPEKSLHKIADAYGLKKSFLKAIIRQIPTLRTEEAPHCLELCGKKTCARDGAGSLAEFIQTAYEVKDGGVSQKGGFSYRVVGCLKKCGKGPVIRWDGAVYTHADQKLIQALVAGKKTEG